MDWTQKIRSPPNAFTGVSFVSLLLLLSSITSGCGSPHQKHVLLVTLDTTRADHLGCYGHDRPTSPVLDALAGEGVLFEKAIAQASVTPVSHASILTGLDPYNHGLRVFHGRTANRLPDEAETLAELWRLTGGVSAAFVSAFPVTAAFGLHQGFDHFDSRFQQSDGQGLVNPRGTVNTGRSQRRADKTTDAAVAWLADRAREGRRTLLWAHYFDPHDALILPPREVLDRFPARSDSMEDLYRAAYDAEIWYMDQQIGRLLEAYRDHDLWEATMVVVVADHGEGLGDHDWWSHGLLYQEQIRVPMIIRLPGSGRALRVPALTRTTDLLPTILEAAGLKNPPNRQYDGTSLMPLIRAGGKRGSADLYAYADSVNMLAYNRPSGLAGRDRKLDKLYCLMNETHKLIYHQLEPEQSEFFDLSTDPREQHNLAPEQPAEMAILMKDLLQRQRLSEIMPPVTPEDTELSRRLKALGYVQ